MEARAPALRVEAQSLMLRTLAENQLWTWDEPYSPLGVEVGARMTIVRLPKGDLWVHSPLTPSQAMCQALDALGPVRHVVAPNTMHYLGLPDFAAAYPDAATYGAPGLGKVKNGVRFDATLGDERHAAWVDVLDQMLFRGNSLTEIEFLHRPSRTLILTDTCHYLNGGNRLTRLYAKLSKVQDAPGPTLLLKMITRDHASARASVERMLEWDFERVIVSHGAIYESGGQAALRDKFAWLLKD